MRVGRTFRWLCGCLLVLGLAGAAAAREEAAESGCVTCHADLDDPQLSGPVKAFAGDVHAEVGLGCVACHGGDARESGLEAMDPEKGFVGVPERRQIVELCGRCHSDPVFMKRYNPSLRVDQVDEYRTSVHGRRLEEFDDPRVAICVSCHPAHSMRRPSDPTASVHPLHVAETCGRCHANAEIMAPYGIPTDQKAEYEASIHWQKLSVDGDLAAPTCNDCHGNHGAAPPEVSWVGNVCGQCHSVVAGLFSQSLHSELFTLMGTPGCATCHGNHEIRPAEDELLGLGEGAICAACHEAAEDSGRTAVQMRESIDALRTHIDAARATLAEAATGGMEVSEAEFELVGAQERLVAARTAVHAFSLEKVRGEVDAGLKVAEGVQQKGWKALEDLRFRRVGLAVSSFVVVLLVVTLLLKIRQLDRRT